jgi:hypothetical protein
MRPSVPALTAALLSFSGIAIVGVARAESPALSLPRAAPAISPDVGVFLDFQDLPAQSTIEAMEREVQSIMRPAGLTFAWRNLGIPEQSHGIFADLVVVRFDGSCSGLLPPAANAGMSGEPVSLADTKISNGQVLHFTDVHCDELRRYLSASATRLTESGRSLLYGRALGRIVSHEMWHILAGTEKHASAGIARACHSRQDLLKPVFAFDLKEEKILREYALRARLSQPPGAEP